MAIMKKLILFFFCLFPVNCVLTDNSAATQSSGMPENKSQRVERAVINKEFAKNLINTALAADTFENQHQLLLHNLNSLDKAQLDQLTAIIRMDMDKRAGEILPLDYIMPWRVAGWICNYIDYRLGRLQYDIAVEGDIGPIDSASTVQYYKFKPAIGHEIIVSIGMTTLQEYNGAIVAGHDWECLPNRVQLLLLRDTGNGPDYYIALKITPLPKSSSVVSIWPQCK